MSFNHKKKYGQNFLTNKTDILNKIIEVSDISKKDNILEIGPGEGALTALLIENANHVLAIEIDSDLENKLKKNFSKKENFSLLMADILTVDLKEHIKKNTKVVANIPYYITSPIIEKLIKDSDLIDEAYLMVQKEVGERICATTGKHRGILTLAVEFFGKSTYLFTVPKENFSPPPKVDSAFISIKFYKNASYADLIDEDLFFKYVKILFKSKRKNILNNLSVLSYTKEFLKDSLNKLKIEPTERAENLSIDKFIELINYFENINQID